MDDHRLQQFLVGHTGLREAKVSGERLLVAEDVGGFRLHLLQDSLELLPRPAGLEIFHHAGLVAGLPQQLQSLAGRGATGVVEQGDWVLFLGGSLDVRDHDA